MLSASKGLLFLSIFISSAHATSTVSETPATLTLKATQPTCEVTGKFLNPLAIQDRVYWKFKIQNARPKNAGICPSGTVFLNVYILGAEYVEKISDYVYPNYVHELKRNQRYLLQVEKNEDRAEWMMSDWTNGVRAAP